jgi:beta-phosphoglucomutase family hydrolase
VPPIDRHRIDALLFDLDGVLTRTAVVHAAAWKRLFDEFLRRQASGQPWRPFDIESDYRRYVDGKPRRDGVRSFLQSRGLILPEGMREDGPEAETIHGLAERKNGYVLAHLAGKGVQPYEGAVTVIREARARGFKTAVVSASENCAAVLAAADLAELFDVRVDGTDIARLGLRGKPAPDTFLEAARRLGVEPARAVVFEDAIAGVQAGRAGGFALVVGVDRVSHAEALRRNGADVVVTRLSELELAGGGAAGTGARQP